MGVDGHCRHWSAAVFGASTLLVHPNTFITRQFRFYLTMPRKFVLEALGERLIPCLKGVAVPLLIPHNS